MADPTLAERMAAISETMEYGTQGDWRVVPSERPTIYTASSVDYNGAFEPWYGGYMGTGELTEFSKYEQAEADATQVVALHNAAEDIVAMYGQYTEMVKLMKWMAPMEIHGDVPAMIAWVKNRFDY